MERRLASEREIRHRGEREQIGACVGPAGIEHVLWAHVQRCSSCDMVDLEAVVEREGLRD